MLIMGIGNCSVILLLLPYLTIQIKWRVHISVMNGFRVPLFVSMPRLRLSQGWVWGLKLELEV